MLFPNSCRCSVGGETIRLSSQSSRVRYPYSAPLFSFSFFFLFFFPLFFPFFSFFFPWELVSSVCMFLFFFNTPPTCNHHLQLGLCWAITMHKSQGQTLDKAVIDLGPMEACTGLTFVCLRRAKRLVDLMVEPMSFDRIGNLGNSSTMKARLQEEVRLVELAQGTRVRYTDMGVFSAVAGNKLTPIQQQMHDRINCNKRVLPALFHLRCPSQSHQRSARGRTRLTTIISISCRSL